MSCNVIDHVEPSVFEEFQSLSGFPMSCNQDKARQEVKAGLVSIPIGFSNELQRRHRRQPGNSGKCFNPYRVFQ